MSETDLELLRDLTDVTEAEVGELRRRVLRQVSRRRRVPWLMAAAAVLLAVVFGLRPAELETLALRMPVAPRAPEVHFTPVVKPRLVREAKAASVIKIFTDDPEVVILLVSDGGEE
jgi:hypothetical protein